MHCFQLQWEYNLRIYDLSSTPFPFSIVSDWRWYEGNVDYFLFFTQILSLCSSHLLREGLMNTTHTSQDRWSRGNREEKGHEFHSSFSKERCAFFFQICRGCYFYFSFSRVLHSWVFCTRVFTRTPSRGRSVMEHTSRLMHYVKWTKRCRPPVAKDNNCSIFFTKCSIANPSY